MVEILPALVLDYVSVGGLPPYWGDKPLVQGLYKAIMETFQKANDLVYDWINGTTISNAGGKNLDDIGFLWNIPRGLMDDATYRQAILSGMLSSSDSGTLTDIKRLLKSLTNASYIGSCLYPNTRLLVMRVEEAYVGTTVQDTINKAVSSGARSHVYWEPDNVSFIPCNRLQAPSTTDLLAELSSGTSTIVAELGEGLTDTLGVQSTSSEILYPTTKDRSFLPFTLLTAGASEPLEGVIGGVEIPLQATLPGGFTSTLELSGVGSSSIIISGRTLALSPGTQ